MKIVNRTQTTPSMIRLEPIRAQLIFFRFPLDGIFFCGKNITAFDEIFFARRKTSAQKSAPRKSCGFFLSLYYTKNGVHIVPSRPNDKKVSSFCSQNVIQTKYCRFSLDKNEKPVKI